LKIGLIGAGAIAQKAYLPALKTFPHVDLNAIVDSNSQILNYLSNKYHLGYIGDSVTQSLEYVDAVIVAVPNYLHFSISKTCLEAGKHVLCEKPLAISSQECEELIHLAREHSQKLAVAHTRRFYKAAQNIKRIIAKEELGKVISFDFEEGTVFSWPTVSGFFFNEKKAGGGVLIDIGVHVFDLLLWWLPYEVKHVDYQDDNLGGVEAFAIAKIEFSNDLRGNIKLSRLSELKNRYRLQLEKGIIDWNPLRPEKFYITNLSGGSRKVIKFKQESSVHELLSNFIYSIENNSTPLASAEDGWRVIQLIERCYRSRKLLPLECLQSKEESP
jgi:predicted dehydrogenase